MTSRPTKVSSVLPAKARRDPVFQEPRSTSPNDSFLQDKVRPQCHPFGPGIPVSAPPPPGPFQEGHASAFADRNAPPPKRTEEADVAPVFVVPFVGCALTKAQHPRHGESPAKEKRTPLPPRNTPAPLKHPSSANQMQPPFKPSSRKENSFSSPPLLLSRLCLAAFPPFGPWSRQRNLKRFPFRGQTRGSPLSRFQATQPRARSRTPSSSPAFHRPP